jgi:FKBP-type peptidyl-prolyl cis-trans isomerase FkpA
MKKLNRNEKIAVTLAILVVGFFFVFGSGLLSTLTGKSFTDQVQSGVKYQDIVVGTGDDFSKGDKVSLYYKVSLTDGKLVDSSDGKSPIIFISGSGQVIKGLEEGIAGMRVGGKRLIIVPPDFGYGSQNVGPIPANSTLIFEVELVSREKIVQ